MNRISNKNSIRMVCFRPSPFKVKAGAIRSFVFVFVLNLCCSVLLGQQNDWAPPSFSGSASSQVPDTVRIPLPTTTQPWQGTVESQQSLKPARDRSLRHANFDAPIAEIADPSPGQGGLLSTIQNGANENLSGVLNAIHSEDGIGSKIRDSFSSIDLTKVFGSLAIVLGLYFGFVWVTRKFNGGRIGGLPKEVVEVLGHAPFGPKKSLQLVRLGSKLLLLLHGQEGTTTIGEISEPGEVEYLSGICTGKPNRASPPHRPAATPPVPQPQVTLPAHDLENVVRKLANAAKQGSHSVFEA